MHNRTKQTTRTIWLLGLAMGLLLGLGLASQASAQTVWSFETVAALPPDTACGGGQLYVWVGGFAFDPANRPVVGWSGSSGCTFFSVNRWARKASGIWHVTEFEPNLRYPGGLDSDYAHALALRADGTPFMVYAAIVGEYFYTWQANLDTDPTGPGSNTGEFLRHYQNCELNGVKYALDFAPDGSVPNRVSRLWCGGPSGELRLNGNTFTTGGVEDFDYATGPAGQHHIIYNAGGEVHYSDGTGAGRVIANVNRFSRVFSVAVDASNRIHAAISGFNSEADYDAGELGYMTSTDGVSWTTTIVNSIHYRNHKPSIALDAHGNPAIAYVGYNHYIFFASLHDGRWTETLVKDFPNGNAPLNLRLAFDTNNTPTIAFFDADRGEVMLAIRGLSIEPPVLPAGEVGGAYTQTLSAIFGTPPLTFALSAGILPPGLSLSADGVISGTPSATGTSTFTVQVTDAVGRRGQREYSMSVACSLAGYVGWWPGDGHAYDIVDANHGTLVNGTTFAEGIVGKAFSFDGIDDFVNIPDSGNLEVTSQFTLAAWIRPNDVNNYRQIISKFGHSPPWAYQIGLSPGGALRSDISGNGSTYDAMASPSGLLAVGTWAHVATTFNAGSWKLYINGVEVASKNSAITSIFASGTTEPSIGRNPYGVQYFAGLIDEASIYNRALSAAEIQAIFTGQCAASPNRAPVANAGLDQTVNEGAQVRLDGSGSSDPDGASLTYQWTQVAGPAVTLDATDPARPTFVAPVVPAGGATLTFQLVVSDGALTSQDTVNITVTNVNRVPVANAGMDQTVGEGALVTLHGGNSFDPDGESLTYAWVQTAGPSVSLAGADTATPTCTAPLVGSTGALLTFALTVSDGMASATDTVTVVVENINHMPIANAGPDQTKNEGSLVTLEGGASSDPDGDLLSYSWSQLTGPTVTLSGPTSPTSTFTAPLVPPGGATLVFQLVVDDYLGGSASDEVTITVLNINDPPACELAQASPASLWPPNHKLLSVGIVGVTDPNSDVVTITTTGVTQDEPVNGLGDGDTSPDAALQGKTVLLRAERSGTGNGRVYQVTFTANDGFGGSCTGAVAVCVPHDQGQGKECIDDGQQYDSTQP